MNEHPRLLLYCQHSLGLGHLVRSYALAAALSQRFDVHLVCGGELPLEPAPPAGVSIVALSPLGAAEDQSLVSRDPGIDLECARALRCEQLLTSLELIDPGVIAVELWPFGRKRFTDEIVALLSAARERPDPPVVVSSVRDVLVASRHDQQRHDDRAGGLAERWLDAVLVHSDPRVARLEETFQPASPLAVPLIYTGFVASDVARAPEQLPEGTLVVSAGGGAVGEPLLRAAIDAHELLREEAPPMVLVAGPFLSDERFVALADRCRRRDSIDLRRSVPALAPLLAGAAGSLSQCGYNTALEIVQTRVPALVVPYLNGREDEQLRRARRLADLGLVRLVDPATPGPQALADAIRRLGDFVPARSAIDMGGASRTCEALCDLLAQRRPLAGAMR
jgi:predicted glycosyltransferase